MTTYLIFQLAFWIVGGGLLAWLSFDMQDMGDRTGLVIWLVVCTVQIVAAGAMLF